MLFVSSFYSLYCQNNWKHNQLTVKIKDKVIKCKHVVRRVLDISRTPTTYKFGLEKLTYGGQRSF